MKKEKKVELKGEEKTQDFFYKLEESVAKITGVTDTATGEVHRFTLSDKHIYSIMRHRYLAFKEANEKTTGTKKPEGKFYYDNQSDLAIRLGIDRKTVNVSIDKLASMGIIKKYFQNTGRGRANNIKSLSYTVLDIFSVENLRCFYDVTVADTIERTFITREINKIVVQQKQIIKPVVYDYEEDPECPFNT